MEKSRPHVNTPVRDADSRSVAARSTSDGSLKGNPAPVEHKFDNAERGRIAYMREVRERRSKW